MAAPSHPVRQRHAAGSTAGLPVAGPGSAVAVARSTAVEVARQAADEAAATSARSGERPGSPGARDRGAVWTEQAVTIRRQLEDGPVSHLGATAPATGTAEPDEREQQEAWLRFAGTDEFRDRLIEILEDRLIADLERRGGRYAGWFA